MCIEKNQKSEVIIPKHIAFVADGNGRWATRRGLPRSYGHKAGSNVVKTITQACLEIGINIVTIYAFSSENWNRPDEEINYLMNLFIKFFKDVRSEAERNNLKIKHIGSQNDLSAKLVEEILETTNATKNNDRMIINIALNYSGRKELIEAIKKILHDKKTGILDDEKIDENIIEKYLYTSRLPNPDLFIRTSGESRLSNFLLWQAANTELIFTSKLWPDFSKKDLLEAINEYNKRLKKSGNFV